MRTCCIHKRLGKVLLALVFFPFAASGQTEPFGHEWFAAHGIRKVMRYELTGDTAQWRKLQPDTDRWTLRMQYDPETNIIREFRRMPEGKGLQVRLLYPNGFSAVVYDSSVTEPGVVQVRRLSSSRDGYPRELVTYRNAKPESKEVSTLDSLFTYHWSGKEWLAGTQARRAETFSYDKYLQPRRRWLYNAETFRLKEMTVYSRRKNQVQEKTWYYDSKGRSLGKAVLLTDQEAGLYFRLELKKFNRRGVAAGFPGRERVSTESSFTGGRYLHIIRSAHGRKRYEYEFRQDSAKPWDLYEDERDYITGKTKYNILYQTGQGSFRVQKDSGISGGVKTSVMEFSKRGLPLKEEIFGSPTEASRVIRYTYDDQNRLIRLTTTMDTTLWQDERWEYRTQVPAEVTVHTVRSRTIGHGPVTAWPWIRSEDITVRNAADPFAYDTMLNHSWPVKLEVWYKGGRIWRRRYANMSATGLPPGLQYHYNARLNVPDAVLYDDKRFVLYRYDR